MSFNYDISRDWFWDNEDLGGFRHSLLGAGNVELWEDNFFIDARASISQQSLQRNGGESADARTVSTNDQSVVVNYSLTPRLRRKYGNWAESDIRLTISENRFLDADTGSAGAQPNASRSYALTTQLRSGVNFQRLQWELTGSKTFTKNSNDRDQTEFSAEYALNRQIALTGRVGREKIANSGINSDDSAEIFWRGGVRLTPGPRTSISFEYGRRFDGENYAADASYQLGGQTLITATYSEDIKNPREEFTDNLNNAEFNELTNNLEDPVTGLPASPNDQVFDFIDQAFLTRNLTIALNGTRGRNSFNINGTVNIRENKLAQTEDIAVQLGGGLNRRIWPNLDGGIGLNISSQIQNESTGAEDLEIRGNVSLSYRIQEKFLGSFQYSYLNRMADNELNDLVENTVSLILRKSF